MSASPVKTGYIVGHIMGLAAALIISLVAGTPAPLLAALLLPPIIITFTEPPHRRS